MRKTSTIVLIILVVLVLFLGLRGCSSYNALVALDEDVKAAWAQVENQYQRRFDLIPNLVETVKGYAKQEREVFTEVTRLRSQWGEARAAGNVQQEQQAATGLEGALSRLLLVVERYPELKSNQNFLQLQSQLEGTENRISVERRRYNEKIREYNTRVRRFPTNIIAGIFGFGVRETFAAAPAAQEAPKVDFGTGQR